MDFEDTEMTDGEFQQELEALLDPNHADEVAQTNFLEMRSQLMEQFSWMPHEAYKAILKALDDGLEQVGVDLDDLDEYNTYNDLAAILESTDDESLNRSILAVAMLMVQDKIFSNTKQAMIHVQQILERRKGMS